MPTAGVTIFGILNVTRDSFSDGGRFLDPRAALDHALELVADGADVIDVGAASSHPEAEDVPVDEEMRRLEPVVADLVDRGIPVSVDSWQTPVQRFAIAAGASWLNDIRGFADHAFHPELAAAGVGLVVMHSIAQGPRATRQSTDAEDVYRGVIEFFDARVAELETAGVARGRIVLDPGMGLFLGAEPEPSILVLRRLDRLRERYGLPLLISVSRKSLVGRLAGGVARRDAASLAAELFAVERGATFIRTHEPRLLRDALTVLASLRNPGRVHSPEDVVREWFSNPARWWEKDPAFDGYLARSYGETVEAALRGELDGWAETPRGGLALVIVLDQFPRNIYRGTRRMFDGDRSALAACLRIIDRGDDKSLSDDERQFLYMPLMHSEDRAMQERSLAKFAELGTSFDYAKQHADIVIRFGRFPHRNAILGRESVPEEVDFLKQPGSSF
jgi:dihydropteroate synthase type 2